MTLPRVIEAYGEKRERGWGVVWLLPWGSVCRPNLCHPSVAAKKTEIKIIITKSIVRVGDIIP